MQAINDYAECFFMHPDFVKNKYLSWYLSIIENAKSSFRKKGRKIYYENHHILPKKLFPEYVNADWNQVLLTAKEHFVVHHLLTRFTINSFRSKMLFALASMSRSSENNKRTFTALQYEILRKIHREKILGENNPSKNRDNSGANNSFYGKRHSEETKTKLRSNGEKIKGIRRSDETKERISKAKKETPHPLFKGYYITPFGLGIKRHFLEPIIPNKSLNLWCTINNKNLISKRSYLHSAYLQENFSPDIIDKKTYAEIGFGFLPKEEINPLTLEKDWIKEDSDEVLKTHVKHLIEELTKDA